MDGVGAVPGGQAGPLLGADHVVGRGDHLVEGDDTGRSAARRRVRSGAPPLRTTPARATVSSRLARLKRPDRSDHVHALAPRVAPARSGADRPAPTATSGRRSRNTTLGVVHGPAEPVDRDHLAARHLPGHPLSTRSQPSQHRSTCSGCSMGYLVVTAVLVVSARPHRRPSSAGCGCTTPASSSSPWRRSALALSPVTGTERRARPDRTPVVQGIGGALLMANSMAIITDAFPVHERGMALGINIVAGHLRVVPGPARRRRCSPASTGASCSW